MTLPQRRQPAAVEPVRQLIGEQGGLGAQRDIAGIEETAGSDHQVAHRLVVLVGAVDLDILLAVADHHAVVIGHHAGGGDDAVAELLAHGFHVGHLDEVGIRLDRMPARRRA